MHLLTDILKNYNIILGSKSPRRQQLLHGLDIDFTIVPVNDVKEDYCKDLNPYSVPDFLSRKKAFSFPEPLNQNDILITADTLVICDNTLLGKPADEQEAHRMLKKISGKTHYVVTSVTLRNYIRDVTFSEITAVTFKELSTDEIDYYISNHKPFDKAGSYGAQDWLGYIGIKKIEGCYYNVVGLPLNTLCKQMMEFAGK